MAAESQHDHVEQLAHLYIAMARSSSDYVSDDVLNRVIGMLQARCAGASRADAAAALSKAMHEGLSEIDELSRTKAVAEELHTVLSTEQKQSLLDDLREVAQLDGVVVRNEQGMLDALTATWEIEGDARSPDPALESWGVLHDLAYIFLVLAHSTDDDLSDTELEVIFNKLREWEPGVPPDDVERILQDAMHVYSEGRDDHRLEVAIRSVRERLPREQRMAALNDLVKIANADGVFLDDEEDLINHLLGEWDVDPYANYEPHGNKSTD